MFKVAKQVLLELKLKCSSQTVAMIPFDQGLSFSTHSKHKISVIALIFLEIQSNEGKTKQKAVKYIIPTQQILTGHTTVKNS